MPHRAGLVAVAAGRRETDEQTHRPAGIGVRHGMASNGRRGKSTRRQMEKLPAGEGHGNASGQCKWIDAKSRATPRSQNQRKGAMIVLFWWLPIIRVSAFTATRGGDNQAEPRAAPSTAGFRTTARLA